MNDRWRAKDRERWNDPAQIRIARRFRHHVRTVTNPKGRIHREICFNAANCGHYGPGEAHHVDYTRPFYVLWVCLSCHRKVDHGSLTFKKSDLWDYASLVPQRHGARVENRKVEQDTAPEPVGTVSVPEADDTPF